LTFGLSNHLSPKLRCLGQPGLFELRIWAFTDGFAKRMPKTQTLQTCKQVGTFASPPLFCVLIHVSLSCLQPSRLTGAAPSPAPAPGRGFWKLSFHCREKHPPRCRQWARGHLASPSSSSYSATVRLLSDPQPGALSLRHNRAQSPLIPTLPVQSS